MEAVVSGQLSAVSSVLGCQNKRRLYPRVERKQTGRTDSCGSVPDNPANHDWLSVRTLLASHQMNMEAFPCPSRYTEGSAKMTNVASHHGTMYPNEPRALARHHKTRATMQQTERQAKPTQNGHTRTQNRACAPPGVRKYPYVRPALGTSTVKACLCQNQINRVATMAAKNGRNVPTRPNKT
jgi:hypothetical protein